MKNKKKNICPYCGGKLVREFIGNYGDVYYLKADGTPAKNRLKRHIYELGGDDYSMVYCSVCGKGIDNANS